MYELQDPEIFHNVLEGLHVGVYITDCQRKILFWNEGAHRVTGFQRHEVIGRDSGQNILPNCNGEACASCAAACPMSRAINEGRSIEARLEIRHKDGHHIPMRVWFVPIRNQQGTIIAIAQSFNRQTHAPDQRRQQNLAMHGCLDATTGIPNQGFTEFHLRENLESFIKYQLPFGIMLIQVDELDHFQSTYGREAVDAIMRVFAQTVKHSLRPNDFIGRWGQDQFLAILANSTGGGVAAVAVRIARLVARATLRWWGDELVVHASLGHASVQGGDDIEFLLQRARYSLQHAHDKQTNAAAAGQGSDDIRR